MGLRRAIARACGMVDMDDTVWTPDDVACMASRLTVVITTSPASDHPRTELVEQVLGSFSFVDGLASCRTIIVCDGYKVAKSCNFRGGKVDDVRRANYEGYKQALRSKIASKHPGWETIELLELQEHCGFGFAVREALALVSTEYLCVVQHDRTFMYVYAFHAMLLHACSLN